MIKITCSITQQERQCAVLVGTEEENLLPIGTIALEKPHSGRESVIDALTRLRREGRRVKVNTPVADLFRKTDVPEELWK